MFSFFTLVLGEQWLPHFTRTILDGVSCTSFAHVSQLENWPRVSRRPRHAFTLKGTLQVEIFEWWLQGERPSLFAQIYSRRNWGRGYSLGSLLGVVLLTGRSDTSSSSIHSASIRILFPGGPFGWPCHLKTKPFLLAYWFAVWSVKLHTTRISRRYGKNWFPFIISPFSLIMIRYYSFLLGQHFKLQLDIKMIYMRKRIYWCVV